MEARPSSLSPAEAIARHKHEVTVAKFIMVGGIGTWVAGLFSERDALTTSWDNYGIPITSTLYIVCGLIAIFRPRWVFAAIALAMVPTSIYQQGVMFLAIHFPDRASYYSAAGSGPWFPLFYVASFIVFPRTGARWAWLHYAGFVVQFLINKFLLVDAVPSAGRIAGEHLLVELLMAHPVYIVALSIITQLRDRLHATQEEAFRAKESFLAMLSHEIRNLLQTMVGSIDLLHLKVKDPTQRKSVDRLAKATGQLQTYLHDIIEFTRLEDPAMQIAAAPFDVVSMLAELHEEWAPEAAARGLDLRLQIDSEAEERLRRVTSDEARLRQIVSNLVSNGLKYTPAGSVTISAGDSATTPGWIRVEVADTGIGIEEASLPKIFQPYVRLENAKRQCPEGSGLGLAVVDRLVKRVGGRLHVASRPHEGSRFGIELPG